MDNKPFAYIESPWGGRTLEGMELWRKAREADSKFIKSVIPAEGEPPKWVRIGEISVEGGFVVIGDLVWPEYCVEVQAGLGDGCYYVYGLLDNGGRFRGVYVDFNWDGDTPCFDETQPKLA